MKNRTRIANRIFATLLMTALMTTGLSLCVAVPSYARSSVKIGQATSGESGTRGQRAGDQDGGEVSIDSWGYGSSSGSPYHWVYVFRAKDPAIAKKIAENMKAAAANNHVGYDKNSPDRNSFYDAAQAAGWDISAITTDCETTCASAVSVCLNAAGVNVPRTWYSGIVYEGIMATDQFYCFTDSSYTASDALLLPGDILCNPSHHTAMVVESPNPFVYEVKYNDENGEEQSTFVEEDKTVQLNLNNGEGVKTFTANAITDLKDYEPSKPDSTFKGWEKLDDESYSARYEDNIAPISTTASKGKEAKGFKTKKH